MKKCNVYASAQLFGFGPTALLLATLNSYTNAFPDSSQITVLGSKCMSILLNGNPNGYIIAKPKREEDELLYLHKSEAYKHFDLFISFFNPAPVLYSWFYNKTCVFHDGLFDFWDIPSFEARLEKDLAYVRKCKKLNNFKDLVRWYNATFKSNPHQVIFMAHYFATRNYIRNCSEVETILNKFPELKNKPLNTVGCIIDPQIDAIPNKKNNHFLVSLGGSIAPVITPQQNTYYAKQIIHFINNIAQRPYFRNFPWNVVCHPFIRAALKKEKVSLAPNVKVISSSGMHEFMKLLRSAKAVFVPPGYGTIQEACYSNKPLFIIPEQNAGQPLYFKTLQDHQFPYQNSLTLTHDLNNGKLIYKEFDIDRMYNDIHTLIYSSEYKGIRDAKINELKSILKNKSNVSRHTLLQFTSMQRMPGGFEGAHTIAKAIQDEVVACIRQAA